jgi:NAD(P)-dependent dehydrogenase (short-subunit alcohol dehydrogenase family)
LIAKLGLLLGLLCAVQPARAETALITGSNRGLGLELVRQYAARGWTVIATARTPESAAELRDLAAANKKIIIEKLDVTDLNGTKALAAKYNKTAIDVLINNAGVLGDITAQTLGTLDAQSFHDVMAVNAYAPLAVSEAFRAHVARSTQKKIIAISSGNGAISENQIAPGLYFYRASKAALNMMMRGLASDLAKQGIIVGIISPGAVDTDMGREARVNRAGALPVTGARPA